MSSEFREVESGAMWADGMCGMKLQDEFDGPQQTQREVLRIQKINNRFLTQQHVRWNEINRPLLTDSGTCVSWMGAARGCGGVGDVNLWHGTSLQAIKSIVQFGFDLSFSFNGRFGPAVYATDCAALATNYSYLRDDCGKEFSVLRVRAALGSGSCVAQCGGADGARGGTVCNLISGEVRPGHHFYGMQSFAMCEPAQVLPTHIVTWTVKKS